MTKKTKKRPKNKQVDPKPLEQHAWDWPGYHRVHYDPRIHGIPKHD